MVGRVRHNTFSLNKRACGIVYHELTNEYSVILLEPNVKDSNVTYYLYGLRTKLWRTLLTCECWHSSNLTSVNLSDIVCWCVLHINQPQLDEDRFGAGPLWFIISSIKLCKSFLIHSIIQTLTLPLAF